MRVGVSESARKQHFIRTKSDTGDQVIRFEGRLLDLSVKIGDIAIQRQLTYLYQRITLCGQIFVRSNGLNR